jgi:hypothetical protein
MPSRLGKESLDADRVRWQVDTPRQRGSGHQALQSTNSRSTKRCNQRSVNRLLVMTVCAGRLTPHASVAVDTRHCNRYTAGVRGVIFDVYHRDSSELEC